MGGFIAQESLLVSQTPQADALETLGTLQSVSNAKQPGDCPCEQYRSLAEPW
jgi:hypothetical protein